ncbi:MAG: GNAT family N-acetyltransferase [bacterium]
MKILIRPFETDDLHEVVKGWNISLPYDRVDENHFKRIILDDPNYEKRSTYVAIYEGQIIGFISSVAREGILGADGRGRPHEKDYGYIKGLFVLENFRRKGIASRLFDSVVDYIRSKGKNKIKVITYTGLYFFPGVDTRYDSAHKFFESKGFNVDHIIDDVDIDLENFKMTDHHINVRERIKKIGVKVLDYDASMLSQMQEFVNKLNMIFWFPEGWERSFQKGNKVVALKGDEIVGWASFGVDGEIGYFGPTAVLEEMRHNGIGSCILLESVLRMKDQGAKRVVALWANTPFYIANGWKIFRQYTVFEKEII